MQKAYSGLNSAARRLGLAANAEQIAELNRMVDQGLGALVRRQIAAGLDVVTDGEQRRAIFIGPLYDAVEGLSDAAERLPAEEGAGSDERIALNEPLIDQRIRKVANPALEEAVALRVITDHPFKVTLPAPSYFLTDFIDLVPGSYATHAELLDDVVAITREIAMELIGAGVERIQFDFPIYPALVADGAGRADSLIAAAVQEGETLDSLLEKALAADSAVVEGLPKAVTVGLHICRGNIPGGMWDGSLAPIAERMFSTLPHDRFLIEWEDTEREGDFSPIRHVPEDRVMVLGLVSTKNARVESEDEVIRALEAATRYLDIAQLAVGTQCGFASVFEDRNIDAEEIQWRKLDVVGAVADRVWAR